MASNPVSSRVLIPNWNLMSLSFTVCIPINILVSERQLESSTKLYLWWSKAYLAHISKPFQVPPPNPFQRLINHMVRYGHSNDHTNFLYDLAFLFLEQNTQNSQLLKEDSVVTGNKNINTLSNRTHVKAIQLPHRPSSSSYMPINKQHWPKLEKIKTNLWHKAYSFLPKSPNPFSLKGTYRPLY